MNWPQVPLFMLIWKQYFDEMDILPMPILRVTNSSQFAWYFSSFGTKSHPCPGKPLVPGQSEQLVTLPILISRTNCMFCYFFPLNTQGGIVTIQSCIPQTFIERLITGVIAAQEPSSEDGAGWQEKSETFYDSHIRKNKLCIQGNKHTQSPYYVPSTVMSTLTLYLVCFSETPYAIVSYN